MFMGCAQLQSTGEPRYQYVITALALRSFPELTVKPRPAPHEVFAQA